jgi:hypothetical protein
MKKTLKKNQIDSIIEIYQNGISTEKICIDYGVSASYICRLLKSNNIQLRGRKKDINEKEIISIYESGRFTMREICIKYNVSKHKIRTLLKSNGIKSKSSKKYLYNDNIFEAIDSEDKAYWLGFLFADGYVRNRKKFGSELRLKLCYSDKSHLIKFKNFITSDNIPITYEEYKNSKCYKVSINSKKIVSDLFNKGCVNKKTKIIEFPNFINEELLSHFIRGYFDGDGSISYSGKQISLNFVCGSNIFLQKLSTFLSYKTSCKIANLTGSSENYKYLSFSSKDDLYKLYDYLYNRANIFLDRKREKYDYIIKNFDLLKIEINKNRRINYANKQDI